VPLSPPTNQSIDIKASRFGRRWTCPWLTQVSRGLPSRARLRLRYVQDEEWQDDVDSHNNAASTSLVLKRGVFDIVHRAQFQPLVDERRWSQPVVAVRYDDSVGGGGGTPTLCRPLFLQLGRRLAFHAATRPLFSRLSIRRHRTLHAALLANVVPLFIGIVGCHLQLPVGPVDGVSPVFSTPALARLALTAVLAVVPASCRRGQVAGRQGRTHSRDWRRLMRHRRRQAPVVA